MSSDKYSNNSTQTNILKSVGIRYDTPVLQDLVFPAGFLKQCYIGYCGNETCVKEYVKGCECSSELSKAGVSAANGVPVIKVNGRRGMHNVVCPHCGYELFWKKESSKEVA